MQDARDERPTVRVPASGRPQKLFAITMGGHYLVADHGNVLRWSARVAASLPYGWASAHRFLADRPELEGAQVVPL